ncbi:aminoacyl-tRNA hydrolase [Williamsia sp. CHRR-6]|uniref:aminoacyl-tRNA hydrolase n=1 Tax=Williamsia sp. CHRR-6 TaxID=2835871 RepID=UPI001BD99998|nr:aminoacyl-tRNA hydrolase [Williamsia sp. CHRR-6]MBT0566670.1 aminoacyl-tRNA hydrolase [Williamsia sp. CHRR-6]
MHLIVGLGNPGQRYSATRHNIGAMVADALVMRAGEKYRVHKRSGADTATVSVAGTSVLVARPTVFMNEIGRQVGPLASFFSIDPEDVIAVHDELDIDFGLVRLKRGGGEGGHNGLRSMSSALGSRDYLRVRLGIGRPPGRQDPADFVLKPFASAQRAEVDLMIANAVDAVDLLLTHSLEDAQNTVHAW